LEKLTKFGVLKMSPPKLMQAETAERPNSIENERLVEENVMTQKVDKKMNRETFKTYLSAVGYLPAANPSVLDLPRISEDAKMSIQTLNNKSKNNH
jgi:hypothetical protein